jgi:hypothetical protein
VAVPLCDNPALAFSKQQARKLLDSPGGRSGLRDRAISVGSQVGLRRAEITANLCSIHVN